MEVFLRAAEERDAEKLLAWRNDPVTRLNSLSQLQISQEHHEHWLRSVLGSSDSVLLIGEIDGITVGVVRLDWQPERDACHISFTVAPEHRGKSYGLAIVRHALKDIRNARVYAAVKISNSASRRLLQKLEFELIDSQGELLTYAKDIF